jgi:hypothetical protein
MIRTIGSIFIAVSECKDLSKFKPTVVEITTHLSQALNAGLPESDPRDGAIKEALPECAGFLKDEFAQFMPVLMTPLIRDAQLDIDFKLIDADTPQSEDPSRLKMNLKIRGVGTKQASLNTHAAESKTGAFHVLERISAKMGKSFAPYVEEGGILLQILAKHMVYKENKKIRKYAMKIFRNVLVAVGYPNNKALFQESMQMFMSEFAKYIEEKNMPVLKILLKYFAEFLKNLHRSND